MDRLEVLKKEMTKLRAERNRLSARIRDIWDEIHYLEKIRPFHKERKVDSSLAYQMFGKPYTEMTQEEKKIYNREAQRRYRSKKAFPEEDETDV